MGDTGRVTSALVSILQNSPTRKLLGAELSLLLKQREPDFNPFAYGCTNLRQFIRTNVKEVFEAGRSGGDVMYSLLPAQPPTTSTLPQQASTSFPVAAATDPQAGFPVDSHVWKTFVSPSGPYRLFLNPQTGEFQVLSAYQASPVAPWVQVPPCSPETHLQIAKEFIGGLSHEATKQTLLHALDYPTWWTAFFATTRNMGMDSQWVSYRRQRLWQEFKRAIEAVGATTTPLSPPNVIVPEFSRMRQSAKRQDDSLIRRVAMGAVRRLPVSELRKISLPLGYIIDEIESD